MQGLLIMVKLKNLLLETIALFSVSNFINTFSDKDRNKILNKKRYNTFLVFHSGNVIMSGMVTKYMRNVYNHFIDITKKARNEIEEKLES